MAVEKKPRTPRGQPKDETVTKPPRARGGVRNPDRVRSGSAGAGPAVEVQDEPVVIHDPAPATATTGNKAHLIAYIVLGVIILVLAVILFKKIKQPGNKKTDAQWAAEVGAHQREAGAWREIARIDSTEKEDYKRMAFDLLNKPVQNKTYYIESKKKYDAVPDAVNALSREQLRREITRLVQTGN